MDKKDNSKFLTALKWPEFRWFWVLLPLIVAVFVISVVSNGAVFLFVQAALLVVILAVIFVLVYRVAKTVRGNQIERSELRNIISSLDTALVVYDKNFDVLFFNPAAEKIFKLDAGEVVGHRFSPQDVSRPEWRLIAQIIYPSLAPTVVARSAVGDQTQVADISFTDPTLELRVSTVSLKDDKGSLLGFMKIIRDRTRELSLLKSKSEFLTVASHQLRTPVTGINWALESLSKDETMSESSRSIVESTLMVGKELIAIVEDLLNVTKIEEGHFGYKFEPTDIVEFINNKLSLVVPSARKVGVRVYFDKPKVPLPKAFIDPEKLSRALINIVENAVRYNVANGEVIVKVAPASDGPFLEISVKDTGIGIEPEDLKNLFKKFFRAGTAVKAQTEGSGLGLYIAKNIVQAHGGKIWVESEPQRGSTFHFTVATDEKMVPQNEIATEE